MREIQRRKVNKVKLNFCTGILNRFFTVFLNTVFNKHTKYLKFGTKTRAKPKP